MPATDEYARLALGLIKITRGDRQRRSIYDEEGKFIDTDGLLESIRHRGVINPLIITRDFTLVAGERRLEASRVAGLVDIPVRFFEDLTEIEAQIIELEENLKRSDLPWRDEVSAVARIHELYLQKNPDHTQTDTRKRIGFHNISEALRVARDMDNPRIAQATGLRMAFNILARIDEREMNDAVNDIVDAGLSIFGPGGNGSTAALDGGTPAPNDARGAVADAVSVGGPAPGAIASPTHGRAAPAQNPHYPDSILLCDFIDWAPRYAGPSFNLIHCDFPYGANLFGGPQGGGNGHQDYEDTPDVYFKLVGTLCAALPKLLSMSGHLMFWLTADLEMQWKTLCTFRDLAPSLIFWPKPLIWHKTDNIGILADPQRGPRHVYETCLFASQDDRKILRAVSDTYGAPTDRSHHPSTKPEPVLRHFMQMFINERTRLLDPTCGSGSAIRAAESLGAEFVLGLEKDQTHCDAAKSALRNFRIMRKIHGKGP